MYDRTKFLKESVMKKKTFSLDLLQSYSSSSRFQPQLRLTTITAIVLMNSNEVADTITFDRSGNINDHSG